MSIKKAVTVTIIILILVISGFLAFSYLVTPHAFIKGPSRAGLEKQRLLIDQAIAEKDSKNNGDKK